MSTTAFTAWIHALRDHDPAFAEASARYDVGRWEWQAPVYLLTGSPHIWRVFGPMTIADGHLGLIAAEALALYGFNDEGEPDTTAPTLGDGPSYTGSDSELLSWAQFLWTSQWIDGTPQIPNGLDPDRFQRWHTALMIRRGQVPTEVPR